MNGLKWAALALLVGGCISQMGREYKALNQMVATQATRIGKFNGTVERYYCFTTKHGTQVFRGADAECPDIGELEWIVELFNVKENGHANIADRLTLDFVSGYLDMATEPCERADRKDCASGASWIEEGSCADAAMDRVLVYRAGIRQEGRAYVFGGWSTTVYHELCHLQQCLAGVELDAPFQRDHKADCYKPPPAGH